MMIKFLVGMIKEILVRGLSILHDISVDRIGWGCRLNS